MDLVTIERFRFAISMHLLFLNPLYLANRVMVIHKHFVQTVSLYLGSPDHTCRTVIFCPEMAPIQSPFSVKARLLISPSAVHAFAGNTSTALAGDGVLFVLGVAGGERA